jgi:glutamyl-tRNA synthetase
MNKKIIDPVAPRYTAITTERAITCKIKGAPDKPHSEDRPKHPKNAEVGTKKLFFSNSILIEQEDTRIFVKDEEITLIS